MYLLPVSTYYDYLHASKKWTARTGGAVLLSLFLGSAQTQRGETPQLSVFSKLDIRVDGLTREVSTSQAEPYEVIRKAGIALGPNDIVSVEGNHIEITRVEERLEVVDTETPFTTETNLDYSLDPGTTVVDSAGASGLTREVFRVIKAGGKEVGRERVLKESPREPAKRIIRTNPQRASRGGAAVGAILPRDLAVRVEMTVEATAYTFTGNNTATGVPPRVGIVAVDPGVIPLGTKLFIEGYGFAVAGDTGGAIKGKKVDVFFNTLKECLNWGRRDVKIYVLSS